MILAFIFIVALTAVFTVVAITSHHWMRSKTLIVATAVLTSCLSYLLLSPVWLAVAHQTQIV